MMMVQSKSKSIDSKIYHYLANWSEKSCEMFRFEINYFGCAVYRFYYASWAVKREGERDGVDDESPKL